MDRFIEATGKNGSKISFLVGSFAYGLDANQGTFIDHCGELYYVTQTYEEIKAMIQGKSETIAMKVYQQFKEMADNKQIHSELIAIIELIEEEGE